jgi:hypothetical protein
VAASGGFCAKSSNETVAFGHRREHLVKGAIEEAAAWLEPKELEWGRISTRRCRLALTWHSGGRKWRAGPRLGCGHAEEGVGGLGSAWHMTEGGVGVRPVANAWARQRQCSIGEAGEPACMSRGRGTCGPAGREGNGPGPRRIGPFLFFELFPKDLI